MIGRREEGGEKEGMTDTKFAQQSNELPRALQIKLYTQGF